MLQSLSILTRACALATVIRNTVRNEARVFSKDKVETCVDANAHNKYGRLNKMVAFREH